MARGEILGLPWWAWALGGGVLLAGRSAEGAEMTRKRDSERGGWLKARYFDEKEATRTSTGLVNQPSRAQQVKVSQFFREVMDPIRAYFGRPVRINRAFSSREVHAEVYRRLGQKVNWNSDHLFEGDEGAADFSVPGVSADTVAAKVIELSKRDPRFKFDQVIWYAPERGGHVHIGKKLSGSNRAMALHAKKGGGYAAWTPPATVVVGEYPYMRDYISATSAFPLGRLAFGIANRFSGKRGVNHNLVLRVKGKPVAFGAYAFTRPRLLDLHATSNELKGNPELQDHLMLVHMQDILSRMLTNDLAPQLDPGGRLAIEHWGGPGARLTFERAGGRATHPLFPGSKIFDRELYEQFSGILPMADALKAAQPVPNV